MTVGPEGSMEDELVGSGRFARLGIRGRRSGESRSVNVGFVEEPDGSLLVAAGSPDAAWARNLLAEPDCTVTMGSGCSSPRRSRSTTTTRVEAGPCGS